MADMVYGKCYVCHKGTRLIGGTTVGSASVLGTSKHPTLDGPYSFIFYGLLLNLSETILLPL